MDRITDKIANLARALNKDVDPNREYIDYKTLRKQYEAKANEEVSQLQLLSKNLSIRFIIVSFRQKTFIFEHLSSPPYPLV